MFTGKENPNFTFDKIKDEFQKEAKKWLPMIQDDYEMLYCYQSFDGYISIIVFWDNREDMIYILRMTDNNGIINASVDVNRQLNK